MLSTQSQAGLQSFPIELVALGAKQINNLNN